MPDRKRQQHRAGGSGPVGAGPAGSRPGASRLPGPRPPGSRSRSGRSPYWIYGLHAVAAALANPDRRVRTLLAATELLEREIAWLAGAGAKEATRAEIERRLPPGAVHQGVAAEVEPLPEIGLDEVCRAAATATRAAVLVLDMVSDPQNVGAALRSAAAFGASALVLPEHGAPEASGALAKAASGALEAVPLVRIVNLRRGLDALKEAGFWCVGLEGDSETVLGATELPPRVALVLGAEGSGLRRLTREACDILVRIPIAPSVESLNVSAAASIALFEWVRGAGFSEPSRAS